MNDYRISPDGGSDFGILIPGDNGEDAIKVAKLFLKSRSNMFAVSSWSLTHIIRDGDPSLHTAVDEIGQHHEVMVTKFFVDHENGNVKIVN